MPQSKFLDIASAPRDGRPIEVRYGPDQTTVLAYWHTSRRGWVALADPEFRVLHRVTGWRTADTALPSRRR